MENLAAEALIVAVVAAVPGLILGAWALIKARAADSPAKWDDKVVATVEQVIRRLRDAKKNGKTGKTGS